MCLYSWIFDLIRSSQTVEKSVDWIMDMDKIRFFFELIWIGYGFRRIRSETRIKSDPNVRISDPIQLYMIRFYPIQTHIYII